MGCLFALFAGLFPRIALLILWIARPNLVDAAFDTFILPLLGFIFLLFTTLMYVILYRGGGLNGFDWFWIGLCGAPRHRPHGYHVHTAPADAGICNERHLITPVRRLCI